MLSLGGLKKEEEEKEEVNHTGNRASPSEDWQGKG
jgi:hypothetical protein